MLTRVSLYRTCPDVGVLSQLVTQSLDPTKEVQLPSVKGSAASTEEGLVAPCSACGSSPHCPSEFGPLVLSPVPSQCPAALKQEDPYITVIAYWLSQEEADTESSNEEQDPGFSPAFPGSDGDSGSDPATNRCVCAFLTSPSSSSAAADVDV